MNKPKIRFNGFTEVWEQRKLGDFCEIKTGPFGSTLHADDYVNDGIPIITTEHFKSGSLQTERDGLPQVSVIDYKRLSAYVLEEGDLVFSRVGSVDINAIITTFHSGWLFSGRVLRVRPSKKIDCNFLHTLLETEQVRMDIRGRAVGQTMPSINTEILRITQLVLPSSKAEQERLGTFFRHLDHLITLHQRKCEQTKKLKKFMLQKMFPQNGNAVPEIRFESFTEAWEQRKLGEVVSVCSGKDYKHLDEGNIPVYGTGGYMLSVSEALSNDSDAIGIGRKGTIDKPYILKAPFWTVDTLFYCIPHEKNDLSFVFSTFQNINWKAMDESTGVPSLSKTAINCVDVITPLFEEQKKIGCYFSNLDHLITLHQKKCDELRNIKKFMLQNMFV